MCNFSKGVWEDAMKAGMEAGAMQHMLNAIENLMENTGWPIERVMSMLEVPDVNRPKYLERLGGQK